MKTLKKILVWLGAAALVGCGGGGGSSGAPPFGGGGGTNPPTDPTKVAASIELVASATQVGTAGGEVDITAFVKNDANGAVASSPIRFATDTGRLTAVSASTDVNGAATAKFSAGGDKTNRNATITVTAGSVSQTIAIAVQGTKLSFSGPTTYTLGDERQLTIKATDSSDTAIPNLVIDVASSLGNGLSSASATTDSQGIATVTYTANNPGSDSFSFSGAGFGGSQAFTISGEDFRFVSPAPATQVTVGANQTVTVRYLKNGAAQPGVTIQFAATAGTITPTSAVTDANGRASTVVSSTSAVAATVTASLNAGGTTASASLPLQFVASTPARLVLQVSPSSIGPNQAGATDNQASVQARVTDVNGNPVAGQTVNFSRVTDPSLGNLSQPSALTDLNGEATVQYIAGPESTANNGVLLRAAVSGTAVAGTATLTVNQSALFIALGTGNVITNIDEQTYKKDWVVYVTDADGVAVPGVTLTIRAKPEGYIKGTLAWNGTVWTYAAGGVSPLCTSEDDDEDGTLDAGEDDNGNGTLEPGNVISVTPGTLRTDANGRATLSLIYAESYAPWVQVRLSAKAIVSGTESKKEVVFIVPGAAEDFSSEDNPPAGVISPFGTSLVCSDPN